MHTRVKIFHHHFLLEIWLAGETVLCYPANANSNKAEEKDESGDNEEPGDADEKFTHHLFPEFCKQQGARKNSEQ